VPFAHGVQELLNLKPCIIVFGLGKDIQLDIFDLGRYRVYVRVISSLNKGLEPAGAPGIVETGIIMLIVNQQLPGCW